MKHLIIVLTAILTLSSCAGGLKQSIHIATNEEKDLAKKIVLAQLKDPYSAKFSEFWAMESEEADRGICGYVNAKISFGGYTGKQMFYVNLHTEKFYTARGVGTALFPFVCEENRLYSPFHNRYIRK